jgi:pyruvate, water dikinase
MPTPRFIRSFGEIGINDIATVGRKNASLGEMYWNLSAQGVRVPNGLAITAEAYRCLLEQAGAWKSVRNALDGLDPSDMADLARRGRRAREIVMSAPVPSDPEAQIRAVFRQLCQEYGAGMSVAVRSSATADLPTATFARQRASLA